MKKVVIALALLLCTGVSAQKKVTFTMPSMAKPSVEYKSGPWMMFGGVAFDLAGIVTYRTMKGGSTTQQASPIYQPFLLPVISGSAVFSVGLVYTIKGK